jgi:translocation and assembly module TamB
MMRKYIKRTVFYSLLTLIILSGWLITTESGLKTSFWLMKPFFSGELSAQNIQGKWINKINVHDLTIESNNFRLNIKALTIKPKIFALLRNKITISFFSIEDSSLEIKNSSILIFITQISGQLSFNRNGKTILTQINTLDGRWSHTAFRGYAKFYMLDNNIDTCDLLIHTNEHQLKIMQSHEYNKLDWFLTINQPHNIRVNLQGSARAQSSNHWQGEIAKAHINSQFIGMWDLKSPCPFTLAPHQISFGSLQLQQSPNTIATAFMDWNKTVGLNAEFKIPALNLHHHNFQGKSSVYLTINQKINQMPLIKGQFILFPGNVVFLSSNNKSISHPYQGGHLTFSLDPQGLNADFSFKENKQNFVKGSLKTIGSKIILPLTAWDRADQNINGSISGQWLDLSFLHAFLPEIATPTGSVAITGEIAGTLKKPKLSLQTNIKKMAFFMPKQGLHIKNLDCRIAGNIHEPLTVEGTGLAGNGSFTLTGVFAPWQDFKTTLKLTGKNLQIYNTTDTQIMVSPAITVNYVNHTLFIQGNIQIPKGTIFIRDPKHDATPSKDVVLVGSKHEETNQPFKVVPSLYLTIEHQLHFKGYDLEGIVGGKLAIEERSDGLLAGTGRLTIIQGKYRLRGTTYYIHHGHLLFPPGTLLSDPILDILISQKRVNERQETDVGIYVQGTLQNPLPHLYSSVPLQNSDILSRLGFRSTEMSGTANQRQIVTQTAVLLSGNANPLVDVLQTNLGLEEFSLGSRETHKISTQGGTDTVLILGKPLSKKLYLQYLQSVMEPVTTVKLKYSLSPYFSTSIETGTEGLGADLTFSMEKD